LGWMTDEFSSRGNLNGSVLELFFAWITFQGLSVFNCYLIGYGIVGIVSFIRSRTRLYIGS
jgi:hypothetical protein